MLTITEEIILWTDVEELTSIFDITKEEAEKIMKEVNEILDNWDINDEEAEIQFERLDAQFKHKKCTW